MEQWNQEQVERVWQRVKGDAPEDTDRELYRQEAQELASLLRLRRCPEGETVCRLARSRGRMLRGMGLLQGTPFPKPQTPPPEPAAALLRRCYAALRRREAVYSARSRTGEFAPVYAMLAADARAGCGWIAVWMDTIL